eukprot:GILI01003764.1.p1 GENE.GILI01003764.1~~GILI01003764.1.p1  ORF type:complete len:1770 (+),score=522.85 GILI01003764.1:205-5310(+)
MTMIKLTAQSAAHAEELLEHFLHKKKQAQKDLVSSTSFSSAGGNPVLSHSSSATGSRSFSLVVDGATLQYIFDDPNLSELFLELSTSCSTVLACRVSPLQKAQVVKLVKEQVKPMPITLAIGDGGNDVSMIQEAHVGIGISGNEGMQAVQASDYAIAQFRYLTRLLFVHGRWNYQRICTVILYSFYKNLALILPMLYFSFLNAFSGTTLYDSWLLMSYNVLWTSIPIIIFGVLDQDLSAKAVLAAPFLYITSQQRLHFNSAKFVKWMVRGIITSIICFLTVVFAYWEQPGDSISVVGSVVFFCIVITVNVKIFIESRSITVAFGIITFLSILLFIPFLLAYSAIGSTFISMYWVGMKMFADPRAWLCLVLAPTTCTVLDVANKFVKRSYYPTATDIMREIALGHGKLDPIASRRLMLQQKDMAARNSRRRATRDSQPPAQSPQKAMPSPLTHSATATLVHSSSISRNIHASATALPPCEIWSSPPPSLSASDRRISNTTLLADNALVALQGDDLAVEVNLALLRPKAANSSDSGHLGRFLTKGKKEDEHRRASLTKRLTFSEPSRYLPQPRRWYQVMSLKFTSVSLEKEFKNFFLTRSIPVVRLVFVCTLTLVAVWTAIEIVQNHQNSAAVGLRVMVLVGVLIFTLVVQSRFFRRHFSTFMLVVVALGIGIKTFFEIFQSRDGSITTAIVPTLSFVVLRAQITHLFVLNIINLLVFAIRYGVMFSNQIEIKDHNVYSLATYIPILTGITVLIAYVGYQLEKSQRVEFLLKRKISKERARSVEILHNMLPPFIVERMQTNRKGIIYEDCGVVTVLFCDFYDFDGIVATHPPVELVAMLDKVFSLFDKLCEKNGVQKIETVGKTYMACGGLRIKTQQTSEKLTKSSSNNSPTLSSSSDHRPSIDNTASVSSASSIAQSKFPGALPGQTDDEIAMHVSKCVQLGIDILREIQEHTLATGKKMSFKIGINTGRVISGVVGSRKPQFALFGDTVNTASRMQSTGEPNHLHLSSATWSFIKENPLYLWEKREIYAKGKGNLETYLLRGLNSPEFLSMAESALLSTSPTTAHRMSLIMMPTLAGDDLDEDDDLADFEHVVDERDLKSKQPVKMFSKTNMSFKSRVESGTLAITNPQPLGLTTVNSNNAAVSEPVSAFGPQTVRRRGSGIFDDNSDDQDLSKNRVKLHPVSLQYLDNTESELSFRDHLFRNSIQGTRVAMVIILVVYIAVTAEYIARLTREKKFAEGSLTLRCIIVILLLCGQFITSLPSFIYHRRAAWMLMTFYVICTVSTIVQPAIADRGFTYTTALEVMLFLTVINHNSGMQIRQVYVTNFLVLVCWFASIFGSRTTTDALIADMTFFLVSFMLINGVAAYMRETYDRRTFVLDKLNADETNHANELLDQMLPKLVLEELKSGKLGIADEYQQVTMLFADICGFTDYSSKVTPEQVVRMLTELFTHFDELTAELGVYKVHTIGDAYVVISQTHGSAYRDPVAEADAMVQMGLGMLREIKRVREVIKHDTLNMRIGLHTGRIVAGVIGTKRLRYDIFGTEVLVANLMESNGIPGQIVVSEVTKNLLESSQEDLPYSFISHTMVEATGKSDPIPSYVLDFSPMPVEEEDILTPPVEAHSSVLSVMPPFTPSNHTIPMIPLPGAIHEDSSTLSNRIPSERPESGKKSFRRLSTDHMIPSNSPHPENWLAVAAVPEASSS